MKKTKFIFVIDRCIVRLKSDLLLDCVPPSSELLTNSDLCELVEDMLQYIRAKRGSLIHYNKNTIIFETMDLAVHGHFEEIDLNSGLSIPFDSIGHAIIDVVITKQRQR